MQHEYEMIRSKKVAKEANSVYSSGKKFSYDHVLRYKTIPLVKGTSTRLNIKADAQIKSVKGIPLGHKEFRKIRLP